MQDLGGEDPCDYCDAAVAAPVVSITVDELAEIVLDAIEYEHEAPEEQVGYCSAEGGWLLPLKETYDLLWDLELTENDDLIDDLAVAFDHRAWVQRDPYSLSEKQSLISGWESFRQFVKHARRYTFLAPIGVDYNHDEIPLHAIPSAITGAIDDADMLMVVPAGTSWWRARPHSILEQYTKASELGSPPNDVARDNRMTPKGIGVFYGADVAECALTEIASYADGPNTHASVARFRSTRTMTLLNLQDAPRVPSVFDLDRRHLRGPLGFLPGFVRDISKPSPPEDTQNLEYVPTQVLAEYFRYQLPTPTNRLDGVVWRSAQHSGGVCCVLFSENDAMGEPEDPQERFDLVIDRDSVRHVAIPPWRSPSPEDPVFL